MKRHLGGAGPPSIMPGPLFVGFIERNRKVWAHKREMKYIAQTKQNMLFTRQPKKPLGRGFGDFGVWVTLMHTLVFYSSFT